MGKLNYLNLGCGNKFHKDWVNLDMGSSSPYVKACNLLKGIPYPDNQFDVVYHSQVLEHIPKADAPGFIQECFRVLKPGGIIRVVVPDLENIVTEYLKYLHQSVESPDDKQAEANYDWLMLEMYDQAVRNHAGGDMSSYLRQSKPINKQYIIDRIGYVGRLCMEEGFNGNQQPDSSFDRMNLVAKDTLKNVASTLLSQEQKVGKFRTGGEVHMWMYDRFSLSRLLKKSGFKAIEVKTPLESNVADWDKFELDVKDSMIYDPTSLFMEAVK